ncbi:hypothetical protein AVEN_32741-1 [Araneus ventricosus]|uniref:Uncharacterized protein n=1 Tax=Araneus ventricosus TaxID=182803 RepID=A0A4Y2CUY8_ARAVE|nr:hypothetical protein AVEN_32741-1 [Araneus ventricosus]
MQQCFKTQNPPTLRLKHEPHSLRKRPICVNNRHSFIWSCKTNSWAEMNEIAFHPFLCSRARSSSGVRFFNNPATVATTCEIPDRVESKMLWQLLHYCGFHFSEKKVLVLS